MTDNAAAPPLTPIRNANPLTRVRVAKQPYGTSLAKQSFASECDINKILKKFEKNGAINHLAQSNPKYGNFIGFQDYHQSMNKILEAQEMFQRIPSGIRSRFNNDPAQFLEFAQNEDNKGEMIKLGLLKQTPEPRQRPPEKNAEATPLNTPEGSTEPPGAPGDPL